ncbi:Uncharacterised protein [Mycobacteroides abscessus subsp. abscessus]|nr:Uncharacterised protein [Mycobacteroides abscessus subsp. abscessus]
MFTQADPVMSVSRSRVPRPSTLLAYRPPGTVSAQVNVSGSISLGAQGHSEAGSTGIESVIWPACARA